MMNNWLSLQPTQEQYHAFIEHLCEAHSWYKHLPLHRGTRFVVFLAPDAGSGRISFVMTGFDQAMPVIKREDIPPEEADFTEAHPRIHHSWKTTKEYRRRFGYLDYMFQVNADGFDSRDAGPIVTLPSEIVRACSFELYPYVSSYFAGSLNWGIHTPALQALSQGAEHPARKKILELAYFVHKKEAVWEAMDDHEKRLASADDAVTEREAAKSIRVQQFRSLRNISDEISKALQEMELVKIRRALSALDDIINDDSEISG